MMDKTIEARAFIADAHDGSSYYEEAEKFVEVFWHESLIFRQLFTRLDLTDVLELGCGHGRHTSQIVDVAGSITLVDILESNIEACRKRFEKRPDTNFIVCSGSNLPGVADQSLSAVFSYDAMVHFEAHDVMGYLGEIHRVLRPGGRALLHHSNYDRAPGGHIFDNPHWRNFFTVAMMQHFASRAGFVVERSIVLPWGEHPELDGLALLYKP